MRIPMVLLIPILLASCRAPSRAQSASATNTKILFIQGFPLANDPVRIKVMDGATELKSDGRALSNRLAWETTFNAGDDWITDLSFVVKNVSAKKITCIIIFSVLGETPFWQDESQSKIPLLGFIQNRLGQRPEHARYASGRALPPNTDPPFDLAPGEELTMSMESPNDYSEFKAHIERDRPISKVTAIDGGIVTVFFDDSTRWISINHSYSRPAEQPGEWTKISYEEWAGKQKTSE